MADIYIRSKEVIRSHLLLQIDMIDTEMRSYSDTASFRNILEEPLLLILKQNRVHPPTVESHPEQVKTQTPPKP